MIAQENCFFHGTIITIVDKEIVFRMQREGNLLRGL
jgi:hypothetical protein